MTTIGGVVAIVLGVIAAIVASMWAPGGTAANSSLIIALIGFVGTVLTSLLTLNRVESLSNSIKQSTPPPPDTQDGGK